MKSAPWQGRADHQTVEDGSGSLFRRSADKLQVLSEDSASVVDLFGDERVAPKFHHRAENSGECEWYTPAEYIEQARRVPGEIDLDPSSSDHAQQCVKAARYYTKRDNGLVQTWHGRVWLNPPYSQPDISRFIAKLVQEHDLGRVSAAMLLTNNQTDVGWFHTAADACTAMCFPRGRIRFEAPDGLRGSPTQGQTFFYFGPDVERFHEVFGGLGFIKTTPAQSRRGALL